MICSVVSTYNDTKSKQLTDIFARRRHQSRSCIREVTLAQGGRFDNAVAHFQFELR